MRQPILDEIFDSLGDAFSAVTQLFLIASLILLSPIWGPVAAFRWIRRLLEGEE